MARFFGTVRGHRGEASRLGHKRLETVAASYQGAVQVTLYRQGETDMATVALIPWQGAGTSHILFDGPVSGANLKPAPAQELFGKHGPGANSLYEAPAQEHSPEFKAARAAYLRT